MSVTTTRGSSDGDKDHVGALDGRLHLGAESETALAHIARHEIGKTGFIDGQLAAVEVANPAFIAIDADYMMSEIGKACSRNQPDIAGTNHGNTHRLSYLMVYSTNPY